MTHILGSGIAGQTRAKADIKCVHAQLADGRCRSDSNGVAAELTRRLERRGVDPRGHAQCRAQCDCRVPESEARAKWWYEPAKNRWKLRRRQQLRKARRSAAAEEEKRGGAAEA